MPRSNRRQGRSFGRRNNPQSYESRSGGFEQTGTGYRYEDQQRRGSQQYSGESGSRNWPGQEDWRQTGGRSRFGGRTYGQEYDQERGFGRGGYEGTRGMGQQNWSSQGYPESYRDWGQSGREGGYWNREDESRYGRGRGDWDYGREGYESESDYEGYEPGEYSTGGMSPFGSAQRFGWSQGGSGQGRSQGSTGQMYRGQFGQERGREYQSGSQQYGGTSQGAFAGRGPQGYKRSDERITEDINEDLTQHPDIDASNISVEVQNGEVTLKGTVPDRETKRRAEDIAESCSGVKDVQNQLRVKREGESESETRKEKGDDKQRSHRQQLAS